MRNLRCATRRGGWPGLERTLVAIDSNSVIAFATCIYGGATLLLVIQIWRDRVQRERHIRTETDARKLGELQSAFYEAWGYWEGHWISAGSVRMDASQVGRQFEALIRLECQLRLNGYSKEANNLGFTARTDFNDIRNKIGAVGVALGLTQNEYRQWKAVGFGDRS